MVTDDDLRYTGLGALGARGETPLHSTGDASRLDSVARRSHMPEYVRSSRLATRAPHRSRCDARFHHGLLATEHKGRRPGHRRAYRLKAVAPTDVWKLVHFGLDFPPRLFALGNDPDEFVVLATDSTRQSTRDQLRGHLFEWMRERPNGTGMTDEAVANRPKRDA